jgi:hypothetical protein
MKIRMASIAIAYVRFVVAATRAQRTRPASMAIVFRINVAAREEIVLLSAIDTGRDVAKRVSIRINEAMAGSDIARRPDPDEA